ncbi:MAG TPA: DCC1-like thiol-disulfide oxidoreductase family protein, partial [Polyangiaceae bacterium]
LRERGVTAPEGDPDTIILIEGERVHTRSGAALRIARHLSGAWKLFAVFLVVPWFVRDLAYVVFAKNRYRLFGRTDTCRVPTPELRARFLA